MIHHQQQPSVTSVWNVIMLAFVHLPPISVSRALILLQQLPTQQMQRIPNTTHNKQKGNKATRFNQFKHRSNHHVAQTSPSQLQQMFLTRRNNVLTKTNVRLDDSLARTHQKSHRHCGDDSTNKHSTTQHQVGQSQLDARVLLQFKLHDGSSR